MNITFVTSVALKPNGKASLAPILQAWYIGQPYQSSSMPWHLTFRIWNTRDACLNLPKIIIIYYANVALPVPYTCVAGSQ